MTTCRLDCHSRKIRLRFDSEDQNPQALVQLGRFELESEPPVTEQLHATATALRDNEGRGGIEQRKRKMRDFLGGWQKQWDSAGKGAPE